MVVNLKVCKSCTITKLLINNLNLPEQITDNIINFYQCLDCDFYDKKKIRNDKRKLYYKENKDSLIERYYLNSLLKITNEHQPRNFFILDEIKKRLLLLKDNTQMELYWQTVNDFMVNFHHIHPGL